MEKRRPQRGRRPRRGDGRGRDGRDGNRQDNKPAPPGKQPGKCEVCGGPTAPGSPKCRHCSG